MKKQIDEYLSQLKWFHNVEEMLDRNLFTKYFYTSFLAFCETWFHKKMMIMMQSVRNVFLLLRVTDERRERESWKSLQSEKEKNTLKGFLLTKLAPLSFIASRSCEEERKIKKQRHKICLCHKQLKCSNILSSTAFYLHFSLDFQRRSFWRWFVTLFYRLFMSDYVNTFDMFTSLWLRRKLLRIRDDWTLTRNLFDGASQI